MIEIRKENDILIIETTQPRLDMVIAKKLKDQLHDQIAESPPKIIMDLKKTNYFDSSILGVLVAFLKDVKSYGGHLVLCNLSRSLYALLKLSKLDILFDIKNGLEEAKEYFNNYSKK